jgi:phosphonate transport system substrate-binding protein
LGREQFGLKLLAVPVVGGTTTYHSYIISRRGSGRHSLSDLRRSTFAFSDPLSNSGYRYVAAELKDRGTSPDRFFARTLFTYSHENTISAVRDGIADGGSVDSLFFDGLARTDLSLTHEIEIVQRSPPFPINPVVASPLAPPDVVELLTSTLLRMSADPKGREALDTVGITGFISIPESAYDPMVQSWRDLGVLPRSSGGEAP